MSSNFSGSAEEILKKVDTITLRDGREYAFLFCSKTSYIVKEHLFSKGKRQECKDYHFTEIIKPKLYPKEVEDVFVGSYLKHNNDKYVITDIKDGVLTAKILESDIDNLRRRVEKLEKEGFDVKGVQQ